MKITYSFADGEKTIIEVDEQWGELLIELDNQVEANEKKETRRHISLDAMDYEGEFFATKDDFLEAMFDDPDDVDILYEAMQTLTPEQKKLLKAIYYEGISKIDYAKKEGVSPAAITDRLKKIYKKIKKFF